MVTILLLITLCVSAFAFGFAVRGYFYWEKTKGEKTIKPWNTRA